jgi:hypothetical protein
VAAGGGAVSSVNSQTGAVVLAAADVGAVATNDPTYTQTVALAAGAVQVEADTIDDVTGRGATTTNAITTGGETINGTLSAQGTTNNVGYGAGFNATGDYMYNFGQLAGHIASGDYMHNFGYNTGVSASGDYMHNFGSWAGLYGNATNAHSYGPWAGRNAAGSNQLYIGAHNVDPGAGWNPTNDQIYVNGNTGDMSLGTTNSTNHIRSKWIFDSADLAFFGGESLADYVAAHGGGITASDATNIAQTVLATHTNAPTAAHDASAISATGTYSTVQAGLNAINANVGAIATMYKTGAQTIAASSEIIVTWEATTNSANPVGCNDLSMASLSNERIVFTTAGAGVYAVSFAAAWAGDTVADTVSVTHAIRHYNGTSTNSIAQVTIQQGNAGGPRMICSSLVIIRSANEWLHATALHHDTDGGAESIAADTRTSFTVVKIK